MKKGGNTAFFYSMMIISSIKCPVLANYSFTIRLVVEEMLSL